MWLSVFYMNYLYYLTPLLIFLSSLGCTQPEPSETQHQAVTVSSFTVSQNASQHLSDVYPAIVTSPNGEKIALTNYESPVNVVVIDREGELVNSIGHEGRGPDELLNSIYFGFQGNEELTVYDYSLTAFKRFSIESGEAESFDTPFRDGMSAHSDHRLDGQCDEDFFIAIRKYEAPTDGDGPIVGKLDRDFNLISAFGDYDPFFIGERSVLRSPRLGIDCERSTLYTTHSKVPFIQVFDTHNEEKITRIDHQPPSFMLSDTFYSQVYDLQAFHEFRESEQSISKIIVPGEHFLKLVFYNDTMEAFEARDFTKRHFYIALYDRDDYSFVEEIPVNGPVYGATRSGELIVVHDDDPENFQIEIIEIAEK